MVREVFDRWLYVRFDEALEEDRSEGGGSSKSRIVRYVRAADNT